MSEPLGIAPSEAMASSPIRDAKWVLVVGATGILVVAGLGLSGGEPVAAVAPPLLVGFLFALTRLPLRWTATTLVFLLLSLEISSDAHGLWASPFVHFGDLLGAGFAQLTHVSVSGFEVLLFLLMGIAAIRRAGDSSIDGSGAVQTASIMRDCVLLVLAASGATIGLSIVNGHGPAIWKARYLLHVPVFFLFFQTAFQRPSDFKPIGVAVVLAAQIKALLAAYIQLFAAPALTGGRLACATNHGDSILFALAVLLLILPVLELWTRRAAVRALLLLPLPLWGMLLNGRRLVWAILAMSCLIVFLVTGWRPWKRKILRTALLIAPILLLYVGLGWNNARSGGVFTPIAKLRTMLDSKVDRSTLWREKETWNIAVSIRESPIIGVGLGGEYTEYMFNDDISDLYPDYRGWPHNTVLGMLLLTGLPGFFLLWLPYLVTVFLAIRAERFAVTPEQRMGATMCIVGVVACLAVAWGDTGAHFIQFKLAAAISMALASKLAVETGAWPKAVRALRRRTDP